MLSRELWKDLPLCLLLRDDFQRVIDFWTDRDWLRWLRSHFQCRHCSTKSSQRRSWLGGYWWERDSFCSARNRYGRRRWRNQNSLAALSLHHKFTCRFIAEWCAKRDRRRRFFVYFQRNLLNLHIWTRCNRCELSFARGRLSPNENRPGRWSNFLTNRLNSLLNHLNFLWSWNHLLWCWRKQLMGLEAKHRLATFAVSGEEIFCWIEFECWRLNGWQNESSD